MLPFVEFAVPEVEEHQLRNDAEVPYVIHAQRLHQWDYVREALKGELALLQHCQNIQNLMAQKVMWLGQRQSFFS